MKRYNNICLLACAALALVMSGCKKNDENTHHYKNKVFISARSFADEVRIERTTDKIDTELSRDVVLGIAEPENFDIDIVLRDAPELLDTYRKGYYNESVELLPSIHYDLSQAKTVIENGKVKSDPLSLSFVRLDELDLTKRYVLPVTIASAKGMDVLESARTMYFLFKKASLVNVVADINENCAWPEWGDAEPVSDMESFTMEALVYGYKFINESSISTVMGIEDCFLIRIGDTTIPKNQLQIAGAKAEDGTTHRLSVTNAQMQLKANRWYHIAVTFDKGAVKVYLDGKEKGTGDFSSLYTSVNFKVPHSDEMDNKPRCFWVGYSYDDKRFLNGRISEVRFWNRALSAEEINEENHFYRISPSKVEGLVAYWKFDDGKGKTIKDYGPYGYDLTTEEVPGWVAVELPEEE